MKYLEIDDLVKGDKYCSPNGSIFQYVGTVYSPRKYLIFTCNAYHYLSNTFSASEDQFRTLISLYWTKL